MGEEKKGDYFYPYRLQRFMEALFCDESVSQGRWPRQPSAFEHKKPAPVEVRCRLGRLVYLTEIN